MFQRRNQEFIEEYKESNRSPDFTKSIGSERIIKSPENEQMREFNDHIGIADLAQISRMTSPQEEESQKTAYKDSQALSEVKEETE